MRQRLTALILMSLFQIVIVKQITEQRKWEVE